MSGLEKIIESISYSAECKENEIISAAKEQADTILIKGKADAEKEYDLIVSQAKKACEQELNSVNATLRSNRNKSELLMKVDGVYDVINTAISNFSQLESEKYFAYILDIVRKYIYHSGTMKMSKRDLERLPKDFKKQLDNISVEKNINIDISDAPADIDDGFILQYGDITENCTIKALIESQYDAVKDMIAQELFGAVKQ